MVALQCSVGRLLNPAYQGDGNGDAGMHSMQASDCPSCKGNAQAGMVPAGDSLSPACRQAAELEGVHDNCGHTPEHLCGLLPVRSAVQPLGEGLSDREAGSCRAPC